MNCARSHALTLSTLSRATVMKPLARRIRDEPRDVVEQRVPFDEQVEAEDQDGDQPEHPADDAPDRANHRVDRGAAFAGRRVLHRLLERHALRQQAVAPQEVLEVPEQPRHAIPELTRLIGQRRDDRQGDGDEHGDDRDIDRQDGERPADADPLLAADPARPVGEADHRRESHRDDGADIDQHQRGARGPHRRPDDHHRGDRQDGPNHAVRELAIRRR